MDDVQKKAQEMTKKVTDSSMANPAEILAPNKPDPNLWAKGDEAPVPADNSNPDFLVPGKPANLWTNDGRTAEVPQGAEAPENTEEQMYDSYGVPGESRETTSSRGIIFDDESGDYMATTHALQNQKIANVDVNEFGKLQRKYAKVDAYTRMADNGLQVKLDTVNAKKAMYEMIGQTTMPSVLDAPASRFWGYEYMPPEEERLEGWPTSVLRGAANMAVSSVAGAYGFVGQGMADITKAVGFILDDKDIQQFANNMTEFVKDGYDNFVDENYIHFNQQGDDSFENKYGVGLGSVVGSIALSLGTMGVGGASVVGATEVAGAAYQARMGAMARGVDGMSAIGGELLAGIGTGILAGSSALVGRMLYKNRSWAAALAKEIAKRPNGRWFPYAMKNALIVGAVDALSEPAQDMLSQYIADGELAGDWKDQFIVTAVVSLLPGLAISAANTAHTGKGIKRYMEKVDAAFAGLATQQKKLEEAGFTAEDINALKSYFKSEEFMQRALAIARDKVAQTYDVFNSMDPQQKQALLNNLAAIPNQEALNKDMEIFDGRLNEALSLTDYSQETKNHILRNLRAYSMLNLMFNGIAPSQMELPIFLTHQDVKDFTGGMSVTGNIEGAPIVGITDTSKQISDVKTKVKSVQDENLLASEIVAKDARKASRKSKGVDLSKAVTQSDVDHELWHFIEQNTNLPRVGEFMEEMKKFTNEVLPGLMDKFDSGVQASEVYAYAMSYAKDEVLAKALGLSKDFEKYVSFLNAYVNVNENASSIAGGFANLFALQQEVLSMNKDILSGMLEGAEENGIDQSVKDGISQFMSTGDVNDTTAQKLDALATAMSGIVDQELAKQITANIPNWVSPKDFIEKWQGYRRDLAKNIEARAVEVTEAQKQEAATRSAEAAQEKLKQDTAIGNVEVTSATDQDAVIEEAIRKSIEDIDAVQKTEEVAPAQEEQAPAKEEQAPAKEEQAPAKEESAAEVKKEDEGIDIFDTTSQMSEADKEKMAKNIIRSMEDEDFEPTAEEIEVLRHVVDGWRGKALELLKPYGTGEDLKKIKLGELYSPKAEMAGDINFNPFMEEGRAPMYSQEEIDKIFHNLTGKRTKGSKAEHDYFQARRMLYYIVRANSAYRSRQMKNLINYSVHGKIENTNLPEPTSFTDWGNQSPLKAPMVPMTERDWSLYDLVTEQLKQKLGDNFDAVSGTIKPSYYAEQSEFYRPEDVATVKFEPGKSVTVDKKAAKGISKEDAKKMAQDESIRMYEYLGSPEYKSFLLSKTPNAAKVEAQIAELLDKKNVKKAKVAYKDALQEIRRKRYEAEQTALVENWMKEHGKEVEKMDVDPETMDYSSQENISSLIQRDGGKVAKSGVGSKAGFSERIEGLKEGMSQAYKAYDDSVTNWVQAKKSIDEIEKLASESEWVTVNSDIIDAALTSYRNLEESLVALYEQEDSGLSEEYIKRVDRVINELENTRHEMFLSQAKQEEAIMPVTDELIDQRINNAELSGSVYSYSKDGRSGKSNIFRRAKNELGYSLKGRWTSPSTYENESYGRFGLEENPWAKETGAGFREPFNLAKRIFGNGRRFNYLTNNGLTKSSVSPLDIEAVMKKAGVELTDDMVRSMCELSVVNGDLVRSELPNKKTLEYKIYDLMTSSKNEVMPITAEHRAGIDAYNAAKKSLKVYTDTTKQSGVPYQQYKTNKDFVTLQGAVETAKKKAGLPGVNALSTISYYMDNIIKGNLVKNGIYTAEDLIYTNRDKTIDELISNISDKETRKKAQAIVDEVGVLADIYTTDALLRTKEYVDYLFDRAYPLENQLVDAKESAGDYLTLGASVIDGTESSMSVAEYSKSKEGKADLSAVLDSVRGNKIPVSLSAYGTNALKPGTKVVMPITMQDGKIKYTEATILSRNRSNNVFGKEQEFVAFVYKDGEIMRDAIWDVREFIDLLDTDEQSVFVTGKVRREKVNELINTPVSDSTNYLGYLKDYVNDRTVWGASKTLEREGIDPTRDNIVKLINGMRAEQANIDELFGDVGAMDAEYVYEEDEAEERTNGDIDENDPDYYVQFSAHGGSNPTDFKAVAQAILNKNIQKFYSESQENKDLVKGYYKLSQLQQGRELSSALEDKTRDSLSSYFLDPKDGRTETRGKSLYEYGWDLYNTLKDRKISKIAQILTTGGNLDPQFSSLFGEDRAMDLNLPVLGARFQAEVDNYRRPRMKALQDIWGNSKEQKAEFVRWVQSLNDNRTDVKARIDDGARDISTGEIMNLYAARFVAESQSEIYVSPTSGGNSYVWERFKQIYKNAEELTNVLSDNEKEAVKRLVKTTAAELGWYTKDGNLMYTVPVANRTKYESNTWSDRHSNVKLMSTFDSIKENSNICAGNFLQLTDQQTSRKAMRENDYMSPIRHLADILFFNERLDNNEYGERFKPGEMDEEAIQMMRNLSYNLNELIREKTGQLAYNMLLKTIKGEVDGISGLKLGRFGNVISKMSSGIAAASLIGKPKHILTNGLGNYMIGMRYSGMNSVSYVASLFNAMSHTKEAIEYAEKTRPDLAYRKQTMGLSEEMSKLSDQQRETIVSDLAKAMSSSSKAGLNKVGDFAYIMDGLMKKWTAMGIGVTNSFPDYLGQVYSNYVVHPQIVKQQVAKGMTEQEASRFATNVLARESATRISSSNPMARGIVLKWMGASNLESSMAFKNDGLLKGASLGEMYNNLRNTTDPEARKALIKGIEGVGASMATYVLIQAGIIEAAIQLLGGDPLDDEQRKYMVQSLFRESMAQVTGSFVFGDTMQSIAEQIVGGAGTEGNIVVNALIKGGRSAVKGDILNATAVLGSAAGMSPLQFASDKANALMYLFGENPDVGARMVYGRTEGTAIKMAGKVKDRTTGEVREQKGEEE